MVDSRGIASTGAVTRIDVATGKATHTIAVGLHPTALALDEPRRRLYVANGNSDSVSVIDTERVQVVRTIPIQPFSQTVRGIAPTALQVSADGATLYVACGGINAVAVIDTATGKIRGLDSHRLVSQRPCARSRRPLSGGEFAARARLGLARRARQTLRPRQSRIGGGRADSRTPRNSPATRPRWRRTTGCGWPARRPETARAASAPQRPSRGSRRAPASPPRSSTSSSSSRRIAPTTRCSGDMAKGNGDPSLVMFGEDVTPNQHRLAEQFVLLDNFYATGGNSADGHQWLTQANETEYCLWPGYQGRSYPFDGSDPMAYSSGGFLWNYAQARGRSVRVYGEYAGRMRRPAQARLDLLRKWEKGGDFTSDWKVRAPIASLNRILAANYPAYSTSIPDVARAQIFLADLKRFESEGKLPNLMLVQLPSNHTNGTTPGVSTPKAMVADNDFAVGQIVEALSHSRFWPKMAIFIVEDDAQNGVDHVDGHRTTAFVVSPYVAARTRSIPPSTRTRAC